MSIDKIQAIITILETTLGNMSSSNADKVVQAVIILLNEEKK